MPTVAAVVVSVATAATLLVPEAAATLPHAAQRVSQGQVAAVQRVCPALSLSLSLTAATRRDPTGRASSVAEVSQAVSARGGRLVVMAAGSVAALTGSAGATTRVGVPIAAVQETLTQDPVHADGRPDGLSSFPVQVWLAAVGESGR